jgi:ParB family chromosome partitioning protein
MATSKKKSILGEGNGLGALMASNNVDVDVADLNAEKVHKISLTEIRPNPYQPRKTFDDAALKDLAESIKNEGVFQPIIVRQPDRKLKRYEIIAGERRFRASQLAELKNIPAIIRDLNDDQMMEVAVVENLQREDLSPLEEAQAYQTLMDKLELTQAQVAKRLGKSRPFIANYLRLLTLSDDVKELLRNGDLSMGQARTLLGLKDKSKISALAQRAVTPGLTVRQLEEIVNQANGDGKDAGEKTAPAAKKLSPFVRATQDKLEDKFGTKVALKSGTNGQGKIEINYLSNDDLTRILEVLDINLD